MNKRARKKLQRATLGGALMYVPQGPVVTITANLQEYDKMSKNLGG